MSIENNIKRIADALEALVQLQTAGANVTPVVETPATPKPVEAVAAPTPSPTVTPDPVVAPTTAPDVAPVVSPTPTPAAITVEQLNAALVVEFKRLGGREGIDTAIAALNGGNKSVTTLPPAQYQALIDAVKAL